MTIPMEESKDLDSGQLTFNFLYKYLSICRMPTGGGLLTGRTSDKDTSTKLYGQIKKPKSST